MKMFSGEVTCFCLDCGRSGGSGRNAAGAAVKRSLLRSGSPVSPTDGGGGS